MAKTFFSHTSKLDVTKAGVVPASTVAVQIDGNTIKFGVSICSKYDNFSKKYGREVAENRMNQGFGVIEMPKPLVGLDERTASLAQLYNIVASVVTKNRKWKKRITKFNLAQKSGAKVVPISEYPDHSSNQRA